MSKKMKFLLIPLALLVALFVFTACGDDEPEVVDAPTEAETEAPTEAEVVDDVDPPSRDLGGREFVIAQWWGGYDTDDFEPQNAQQEAVLEWRRYIEERYNFRMREVNVGGWDAFSDGTVMASILAGDALGDIIHLNPVWFFGGQAQGLFADVSGWDFATTDAIPWNQAMIDTATFGDAQYGFTLGHFTAGGIHFNQRLFQEAGLDPELPYELVASGEWTWEKFMELAHTLTHDPDNVGYNTTFGLATFGQDILHRAVFSNGAEYVGRDADGNFFNATNTPEFMEALQFVYDLQHEGVMMPQPEDSEWNWFQEAFWDGHAAMRSAGHYVFQDNLNNMEDPWGFVPFPMGPRATTHYTFGYLNFSVIPHYFTEQEIDDLLFAYNLWVTVPEDFRGPDVWKSSAYTLQYNPRSVDESIALHTRDASRQSFPFQMAIPGIDIGPDLTWEVWSGDAPAQLVERIQARWDSHINVANGGEATYIPADDYDDDDDDDDDE